MYKSTPKGVEIHQHLLFTATDDWIIASILIITRQKQTMFIFWVIYEKKRDGPWWVYPQIAFWRDIFWGAECGPCGRMGGLFAAPLFAFIRIFKNFFCRWCIGRGRQYGCGVSRIMGTFLFSDSDKIDGYNISKGHCGGQITAPSPFLPKRRKRSCVQRCATKSAAKSNERRIP